MATRDELVGLIDSYLDAVAERDPARLPLAPGVRFTENCQALAVGKGLWATATGRGPYSHAFADTSAGQAGCFATVEENGSAAILFARLKVEAGRISEIETLVARWGNPIFAPENLTSVRPLMTEVVAPADRSAREELVRIASLYFDGIERNDGSIIPITDECIRLENGIHTANNPARTTGVGRLKVAEAISTGFYTYIPEIRDRRWLVVDEERGLALGLVFFDHPGTVKEVEVPGMGVIQLAPFTQKPSTAVIAELFKIKGGKICDIEAVLEFLPYGIRPGWE